MQSQEKLTQSTIQTYIYLIKAGKPVGPREVMREAKLTSPSVAYRNLQKLIDLNLSYKDKYGNYGVKEKKSIKGYFWIGKNLVPRFIIFGLIFTSILILEVAILIPHLISESPVESSFWLLTILTITSAAMFLVEGIKWKENGLWFTNVPSLEQNVPWVELIHPSKLN